MILSTFFQYIQLVIRNTFKKHSVSISDQWIFKTSERKIEEETGNIIQIPGDKDPLATIKRKYDEIRKNYNIKNT